MNLPEDFEDLSIEQFYSDDLREEWEFFQNPYCNDDEANYN